jgi:hypothetical protein
MNINELAGKPKLIKLTIDDPTIVEKYGDTITFHTWDIVSLGTYFEFYNSNAENQFTGLEKIMRKLILLEDGKPALKEDEDLPIDIATEALTKIGEVLGKSQSKPSTSEVGAPQK